MAFLTQIAEITDYLYLCSATAITRQRISMLGITNIINCTLDVPDFNIPGVQCTPIRVDDHPQARLDMFFDRVADEISTVAARRGKVIVHCVAGVSRSASLCIAYLMKYHRMSLVKAHDYVKRRRSMIRPNMGFWRQLIDYERRLYGRTTVQMVPSSIGLIPDVYTEKARAPASVPAWSPSSYSYTPAASYSRSPSTTYSRSYGRQSWGRPRLSF